MWGKAWAAAVVAVGMGLAGLGAAQVAHAQPAAAATKPAARPAVSAKPAAKPAPAATAAAAAAPARSGKGWRTGPIPAWVVAPPEPDRSLPPAPATGTRRDQLVDVQVDHTGAKAQSFIRVRSVALDAAALGGVSQWQLAFNPAFQTLVVHHAHVWRDGQRSDRLAEARIEPMRRETGLEQLMLDGVETLLLVLGDVRVGDAVEVAYTLEGENPIFEGRISGAMRLAYDTPMDVLHHRWRVPAGRTVQSKGLASDAQPERFVEGGVQVLRATRQQVPALLPEQSVPPWVKMYPAIDLSEWGSWSEVDAWAQRLFATAQPVPAAVAERAQAFRASGLQGAALVSEVLRFVQDEVRYLSVSLGESSHRPKPPERTLAERLGDCKDKVVLLNALLRELGFAPRPALVSMQRNKGIRDYLPSHDVFDHVITRLELDGRTWWLDPTIQGQGLVLASRGQWSYGSALVVGDGAALADVAPPAVAVSRLQFEQRWDLSRPGAPVVMRFEMRAHGHLAERWRAGQAQAGSEALSKNLAASYARVLPGLRTRSEPVVSDDRQANVFVFQQEFELPELGQYNRGALDAEFGALELLDTLGGPPETTRKWPVLVDTPRLVESRIIVTGALPFPGQAPEALEVVDRQFRFTARMELQGAVATFVRRYEQRDDQVNPGELAAWRDKVLKARNASFGRVRLPLVDVKAAAPQIEATERRLRNSRGWRDDQLGGIVARQEFSRLYSTLALERTQPGSPLAARMLVERATANNLLGQHDAAVADAESALKQLPDNPEALDALAVARVGLGQAEEALATFARITPGSRPASVAGWMGSLQLLLGRPAEAEPLLREAIAGGSGEGREFSMVWLYLAAERNGGRGRAAVEEYIDAVDASKITGALLRYMVGRIDSNALLRQAGEDAAMARLNQAEAHFYIGQRLLLQGQRDEALRAFQRTLDTRATPYRELSFAQLELKRAAAPR
jgi:lipoprotein NlpI/transglutaminase-like putative cysteine protease